MVHLQNTMLVRATLILLTSVCLGTVAGATANRDVVFTVELWWHEYVNIVFSWDKFQEFLVCLCGTYHPFCVAQYDNQNGNQTTNVATNGTEIIGWEEDQKFYRCFVEFWHARYDKLVCQFQVNGSSCADNRLKFQAFRVSNSDCGSLCTELSWDYSSINVAFHTDANVEFYPDSCECPPLPNTTTAAVPTFSTTTTTAAAVPTISTTTTTTVAAATLTTTAAVATISTTTAAATTSATTAAATTSSTTEAVPTFSTRTTTIEATTTSTVPATTTATKTAITQPPTTTTVTTTTTTTATTSAPPPTTTTVTSTTTSTTTTPAKPTTTTTTTETPTSATIPTASSSTQTLPVSTTTGPISASQSKDDTSPGVIIGVVIAVIVFAVIIAIVVYFVRRGKHRQYSPNQQKESSTSLANLNIVRSSPQNGVTDINTDSPYAMHTSPFDYYNCIEGSDDAETNDAIDYYNHIEGSDDPVISDAIDYYNHIKRSDDAVTNDATN